MAQAAQMQGVQRSTPTPFLAKTYALVNDPSNDEFVSWTENGSAFIIKHPVEFARDLLPRYFKHNNMTSFVRQLNQYGFRKVSLDFWEFSHDLFKRDQQQLLVHIRRGVKNQAMPVLNPVPISAAPPTESNSAEEQVISSNSAARAVEDAEIVADNKRLKRENAALRLELYKMRSYCNNVANVMNGLARGGSVMGCPVEFMVGSSGVAAEEQLFDVPIGVTRVPVEEARGRDVQPGGLDLHL